MSFINSFFEKNFEHAQSLFFDVRFLFFGFTLISSLGFLIIYSFLYGYYFGGDEIFQISNFSIISNLIPFNLKTLTITSIFFVCIYYIFSVFISLIIKNKGMKLHTSILLVFTALLLNVAITMFFANELTFTSMLSFCLIWVFVGLIICYIYVAIKTLEHPFVTISGFLFHIVVFASLLYVLGSMGILEELEILKIISVLSVPSLIIITTMFHYYHRKRWFDLISYLSISLTISVVIVFILEKYNLIFISNIITLIILVLILHFIILKIMKWLPKMSEIKKKFSINVKFELGIKEEKERQKESKGFLYNLIAQCYSMLLNKANNTPKLAISLILLLAFVLLPRLSLSCGQLIRGINEAYESSVEITYVNQSGKEKGLIGNYYIENNSTLYVANKCWELEVIKPVNYHIKPMDKGNKQNCDKKD
ncbi:hypothetical protein [Bacillus dicomae]|uniref:Uncharacterized protein n=1 Tax=Bacillus dicomae TaxID=3088378 RepID=A0AC61T8L5_9BACI|nr:hypothetical protein [Bacillus dicomae]TPV45952.1 hypothetical protein FJ659_01515 [Bacillus dicomae]